jgi:hypothetical protein
MNRLLRATEACRANVYVTVSDGAALAQLNDAAGSLLGGPDTTAAAGRCLLLNHFFDPAYERSSWSFGGSLAALSPLVEAFVGHALSATTSSTGRPARAPGAAGGAHPRLGAVDHVSLHPLLRTPLGDVGAAARGLGERLAATHSLPVYLYGAARSDGRTLADIRRASDYFRSVVTAAATHHGDTGNGSSGAAENGAFGAGSLQQLPPDYGPPPAQSPHGVCTLGAVPPVLNYNVRLHCADGAVVRRVARAVSTRGGGLPGVEALALPYGGGSDSSWEVACNLLDQAASPPSAVLARVRQLLEAEAAAALAASGGGGGGGPVEYDPVLLAVGVKEPLRRGDGPLPPAAAARIVKDYTIGLSRRLAEAALEAHFTIVDEHGVEEAPSGPSLTTSGGCSATPGGGSCGVGASCATDGAGTR